MSEVSTRGSRASTPLIRERILVAGLELFHTLGYSATGVKDITDKAGVPKGSFYNHFESKQELAIAALERYALEAPLDMLLDKSISPLEGLRAHFDEMARRFTASGYRRGCMMGNFSNEMADAEAPVREVLGSLFEVWINLISTAIAEGQSQGLIASTLAPEALAGLILSSWEGSLIRSRAGAAEGPMLEFFDVVFGHLLAPPAGRG